MNFLICRDFLGFFLNFFEFIIVLLELNSLISIYISHAYVVTRLIRMVVEYTRLSVKKSPKLTNL